MAETVDMAVVDQLMWDALQEGAGQAAELGLYGPGQDLVADAFTGNLRGAGPGTVALPFPVRKDNASQTVLVSFADKTEPMAFNHDATGAYMLPRFNTGLVIAASKMKRGYLLEIVDLDTKAQAIEAGAHPRDPRALDAKMEELAKGLQEKVITPRAPEDASGRATSGASAISSGTCARPSGCTTSRRRRASPTPSYWSGPILSAITLSCNIHAGRIGAISDQLAFGTRGTRCGAPRPSWRSSSVTRTASSSRPRCTRTSSSTRRAGRSGGRAWSGSSS
jgi:hypothetical protein